MGETEIGIPDDSPESSVAAILTIVEKFATDAGGECDVKHDQYQFQKSAMLDVRIGCRYLRMTLSYTAQYDLPCVAGAHGEGYLWPSATEFGDVGEHWKLELRCFTGEDSLPHWLWGLYPPEPSSVGLSPSHILDESQLLYQLRERLLLQPPV